MKSSVSQKQDQESAIRSLFRLSDEIARTSRNLDEFSASTVPVVQKSTSIKGMSSSADRNGYSGATVAAVLLVGTAVGGAIGWQLRGSQHPASLASNYRPASMAEANRLLDRDGLFGSKEFKTPKLPPLKIQPSYEKETVEDSYSHQTRAISGNLPEIKYKTPGVDPMSVSMPAPLTGTLPGGTLPSASDNVVQARPDLHRLEANVRTAIANVGGKIVRASEADGSVTLTTSVRPDGGGALRSAVRRASNGLASVSEVTEDDSDTGSDPVQAAEIKSAQDAVTALKAQLAKDEVSFLPEAPALRSVKAQYLEAVRSLAKLQQSARKAATFEVVISS